MNNKNAPNQLLKDNSAGANGRATPVDINGFIALMRLLNRNDKSL